MREQVQNLSYAARWLRDGLHEASHAGALEIIDVDVSKAAQILKQLKAIDRTVTWTHVFVRSVALTLARHPELHQLVAGNRKIYPGSVDIGLSIAGDESVTPVLVIEDAANKELFTIAAEVVRRTPQVVEESKRVFAALQRWGWILPFSALRRSLFRFLFGLISYRRKISGTFQISSVPQVDIFAPMIFNTAGVLGIGGVRDRVIVENGVPVVRPVVTLTCCLDHAVWNGMAGAKFLNALCATIQTCEFAESVNSPGAERADLAL